MRLVQDGCDLPAQLVCGHQTDLGAADDKDNIVGRLNIRPRGADRFIDTAADAVADDCFFGDLLTYHHCHAAVDTLRVLMYPHQQMAAARHYAATKHKTEAFVAMEAVFVR